MILLNALALLFAGPQDGSPLVFDGKRVLVRSTSPHRPAAERCRDMLEAALPVIEDHLPYRLPQDQKLVINLFATKDEYAEAIRKVGGERFVENQAFSSWETKESYIVIQPRSEPAYLDLVGGLPELTRYLACHEAVHQLYYRADAPNYEWWPHWYGEGMADFLAERCLSKESGASSSLPILFEHVRTLVQELREKQGGLDLESLLDLTTFSGGVSFYEAYAVFHSFYRFLAADKKKIEKLHEKIRGLGGPGSPGAGMPDERASQHAQACMKALIEVFGPLKALQTRWVQDLKKQPGLWYEHFRSSQRVGDEIICAGFPESNAILIAPPSVVRGGFSFEGELNITGIGSRQADLYLDFDRSGGLRFLKIAMGAGSKGFVTLLPFSNGEWQESLRSNVEVPTDLFPIGEWVPFRIQVQGKTIRLDVGGKSKVELSIPVGFGGSIGRWGIGSHTGVVRFRNLKTKK